MDSSSIRRLIPRQTLSQHYAALGFSGATGTRIHVLLTGSTGNLGSYLLEELLSNGDVKKVTCLNRSPNAKERQKTNAVSRGLSSDLLESPALEFLKCDLSKSDLGVEPATYQQLASSTTHILHNAWLVDFNHHLTSFTPHIAGVRNLINFTLSCANQATLFFVSSISVVGRWGTLAGASSKVPEEILGDWRTAKMGYGQSKLLSERLLAEGAKTHGIKTTICRVGQVAGPVLREEKGRLE